MKQAQFMARVTVRDDGCWDFRGEKTRLGYVRFWIKQERFLAHRFAYVLMRGPIEPGMEIDHLCWNRSCCNPEHLSQKTHSANCRSKRNSKLTAADVEEIRRRRSSGETVRSLMESFRVSDTMIYNVINRKAWK